MERPGITWLSYIYIYIYMCLCVSVCVFVCDLAKALLASIRHRCLLHKKTRKTYSYLRVAAAAERESPVAHCWLSYIHMFVFVCVSVSMMRGGDGQRLSRTCYYCHRWVGTDPHCRGVYVSK